MTVLLLGGSPSERSRSSALLESVALRLHKHGLAVQRVQVRELPAQALLQGDATQQQIARAVDLLQQASALVVATPVYKAAYSGVLKLFLDLLPQTALKGKVVLPLATGGSPHHMLALDYALRPVLQSLAARHILPGVYAVDAQITLTPEGAYHIGSDIAIRLDEAVGALASEGQLRLPATTGFEPVPFSRVRCSV